MVECRFPSRLLFYWNGDCCCKYRASWFYVMGLKLGVSLRSPLGRRRILVVVCRRPFVGSTSVSSCTSVALLFQCRADNQYRFYICGVTVIGLLVPSNSDGLNLTAKTAAASPFVIAIKTAGIKGLPSLINACLLTSGAYISWSSRNRNTGSQVTTAQPGLPPRVTCTPLREPFVSLYMFAYHR